LAQALQRVWALDDTEVEDIMSNIGTISHFRGLAPLLLAGLLAACDSTGGSEAIRHTGAMYEQGGAAPPYAMEADEDSLAAGEKFENYGTNPFVETSEEATSTFSVDVDTASYSIMRRDLNNDTLPQADSVRVEEFVNYFRFSYAVPTDDVPFAIHLEGAPSFFGQEYQLLRVALKGFEIPEKERKPANLVFLIDVSGSMNTSSKLGLVKFTMKKLVDQLRRNDTLGIVIYAGSDAVLLEPTPVLDKSMILDAIDGLSAGGSTAGAAGIKTAYELAESAKMSDGVNRVVLCTDGDFNVGLTGDSLIAKIEEYREKGINLTIFGYGMGNYNDQDMEKLADKGNGNYAYIDSPNEALHVIGDKLVSTLQVIAKDVKIQVDFNVGVVAKYRLIGYENRVLDNEDFTDDTVDAGDIGSGHNVTAFYELEMQTGAEGGEVARVKVRYKEPEGSESTEVSQTLDFADFAGQFDGATGDFRFAVAVAEFAEILRESEFSTDARFDDVHAIASGALGNEDPEKLEFLELVLKAQELWP
jgi:Ca-activated chloride channel homolog